MRFLYVFLLLGVSLVLYLSWLPDGHLRQVWFIPDWLSAWSDQEANQSLRTGVPFVFLGVFAGLLPVRMSGMLTQQIFAWLLLVSLVVLAELGQLLLPQRGFSWRDIGWGATGSALGLLVAIFGLRLYNYRT